MKSEVSCLNTRAILDFLRRRGLDPGALVAGLDPDLDALEDPLAYLSDRNNWVPQAVVTGLFSRIRAALGDERIAYTIGFESFAHRRFGYVQNIILRLFLTPEQGLRKAQEINDRFNRTKRIELAEVGDGRALVRLVWFPGMGHTRDVCLYNQGIYSAITRAWGTRPATVIETTCAFDGGDCCEYQLRWDRTPRPARLLGRFVVPRGLFQETVRELEEDKALLSQKYREVQDLTVRLRRKIRELETIHESGRAIVTLLDRRELLNVIMRLTTSSLGYDRALLMLCDEAEGALVMAASSGGDPDLMRQFGGYRVPLSRTSNILVRTFSTGTPALVADVSQAPLNLDNPLLRAFAPTSFAVVPLISRGHVVGVLAADRTSPSQLITPEDLECLRGFCNHVAIALENSRLYQSLEQASLDAIQALARAVEAKDPYTHGHSERVSTYAELLAGQVGLSERETVSLRLACLIHDIGKIGVSERILHKPGRLEREEETAIRQHPAIGETILRPLRGLEEIARIIRHHHERYDGLGYPDRLAGEEIPVASRVMAIADTFDAMTTARPYRQPLPWEEVARELRENRGRQFDPRLVDAFLLVHAGLAGGRPSASLPWLRG